MRFFGTLLEVKESEVRHELEINKQRDIERQRKKEHKYLEKLKKRKKNTTSIIMNIVRTQQV